MRGMHPTETKDDTMNNENNNNRVFLMIIIEGLECGPLECGTFHRFAEAWEAMVDLNCGNSNILLKDERGVTRSRILDGEWLYK